MSSTILVTQDKHALGIRLNRPEKKNALTGEMYMALADALDAAEFDSQIRVVTLTGTQDSYTSGNDIDGFASLDDSPGESPVERFLRTLAAFPKPVVAAVNGLAVGIGVTMLLHCETVLAAESATFRIPFVDLGLVPEAASSLLLPRLIGYQRAGRLLLYGERITAAVAHDWGLVESVHADNELQAALARAANILASKPPTAVRLAKALLKSETISIQTRIREELFHLRRQIKSDEAQEAFTAFREKRAPDFSRF